MKIKQKNSTEYKKNSISIKKADILFLHCVLLLYSCGGIMSKKASGYDFLSLKFCVFYGTVLGISVLYALLWQKVLKRMPLVVAYANKAVTVIWGLIWGAFLFQEQISIWNILGALIIIGGVYLVITGEEEA